MQLTSENLVIVTRDGGAKDSKEVLVGRKKRGRFADHDIFPGGKAEGTVPQDQEAARELQEESGISVAPDTLRYLGKLLIYDKRPGQERFGNVFLYGASVEAGTEAIETDELDPRWQPVDDPQLTNKMPPDVSLWWPAVRQFDGTPIITHLTYDEDGALDVIVKKPDIAHTPGEIIQEATFPSPDRKG